MVRQWWLLISWHLATDRMTSAFALHKANAWSSMTIERTLLSNSIKGTGVYQSCLTMQSYLQHFTSPSPSPSRGSPVHYIALCTRRTFLEGKRFHRHYATTPCHCAHVPADACTPSQQDAAATALSRRGMLTALSAAPLISMLDQPAGAAALEAAGEPSSTVPFMSPCPTLTEG